jgi:ABC-type nitrate/sulfonate/bicarbonate transport system substrate-binding protein
MFHRIVAPCRGVVPARFVALLALAALCALPHAALAQQKVKIRAVYIPVATWLPVWVAQDKGIFAKHGLDVSLMQVQNVSMLPGMVGQQFDIAPVTGPDLLNAAASGLDVVAVAGETIELSSNQSVQIMVRPDGKIKTAKDLDGKRIATPSIGAVMHVATLHWMNVHGGNPNSLVPIEVPFPNMMDQLKAGRVDAVEALQPFVGQMRAAGFKSLGDPLLSVGDPVLFPFWMAQGKWARAHRDVIGKWISSLDEANKYIKANDGDARKIMSKYTHLPDKIAARIPLPDYQFTITPQQLEVWLKVAQEQGRLKQGLDVNKLVVTAE